MSSVVEEYDGFTIERVRSFTSVRFKALYEGKVAHSRKIPYSSHFSLPRRGEQAIERLKEDIDRYGVPDHYQ